MTDSVIRARQIMSGKGADLVVIAHPLEGSSALEAAEELSGAVEGGLLLFVPSSLLDQALYQMRELPVFVLSSPPDRELASQAVGFLEKSAARQKKLRQALQREKQKLQDEKVVFQCKLKLVELYHWPEDKAHAYIQKLAMDHSRTRADVAAVLLERMASLSKKV